MLSKKITAVTNEMILTICENTKFKTIFDNLDESIIIIHQNNNKIEYANNKFFR